MRPELPFVSIIIPTYARALQLASCLESIACLDYPRASFEVIVVDDGSNAPPVDVVASFGSRMNVKLLTQGHAGPAAARNTGAASARGDFFVFTDDDCLPDRNWLRALAAHFTATPDALVGGRTLNALAENLYSATSQAIIDVVYEHFNTAGGALFFASNNFAVPAVGFHKVGGFDEKFITSEDREFCDRWVHQGYRLTYAPEVLNYHAHPLTLRTLWQQHFGYGRGAFRFHRARYLRYGARINPDSKFYFKLLSYPSFTERGRRRALALTALVCWTQLASSAGFAWEMIARRHI
jgi:glycosyltransferase involved in cell wall biosynthesis